MTIIKLQNYHRKSIFWENRYPKEKERWNLTIKQIIRTLRVYNNFIIKKHCDDH